MKRENNQSRVSSSGFFGREAELREFAAALGTRPPGTRVILLGGEPGAGKTRLAEEMAAKAEQEGFLALWGYWREGVRRPEYWVWGQVLRGLLQAETPDRLGPGMEATFSELSNILPEIKDRMPGVRPPLQDVGEQKHLRLINAVLHLLGASCRLRPLLLVFDNLHLAQALSLDLLSGVIDESTLSPLLVLATYRNLPVYRRDPFLTFLSESRARRSTREMTLGPLTIGETEAMATSILGGAPAEALLRDIWEKTRGHPLFVHEAARLLRQNAQVRQYDAQRLWHEMIPEALNTAVELRVRGLSSQAADTLRRVAAIGESVSLEEIRLAGGSQANEPLEELEEAVRHGFLLHGDSEGEYHFAHPLIHSAIRLQLPLKERRLTCAGLAEAVEREHASTLAPWVLRLIRWWSEGVTEKARSRVRMYTRRAAETAMASGSWEEAISLYERVNDPELEAADTEEAADVLYGLGSAYYRAGNHEKGIFFLRKAFASYKRHGRIEQMTKIASEQSYLLVGQPGFYDFFSEILPLLPRGSQAEAAVLHFYGVAQTLSLGDYPVALATFQKALEIGESVRDPVIQARNLAGLAFVDNAYGRYAACVEKVLRVLELVAHSPDPYAEIHADYVMSTALLALGRGEEAVPYEDRELEIAYQARDGVHLASACQLRARHPIMNGAWEEAGALIEAGLAACPDHLFVLALGAFVHYTRGEFEAGDSFRRRILAIQKQTPTGPWRAHIQAASTAAVRARNSGDSSELAGCVPRLRSIAAHPAAHQFIRLRAHLLLAFIAALTDDAGLARTQYRSIQSLPRLELVRPYLRERFLGLAAHCYGDHTLAVSHLEAALRLARLYGDKPLEAWILCELGEALIPASTETDSGEPARLKLVRSGELSSELRMPPLERRVKALLELLSDSLSGGLPAHTHLSEREKQVIRLLSSGLSNQEIARELCISPYTVGNHVCHILEKLGVSNRTEAVSRARKMRLVP